jgi:hypothetical protein
VWGWKLDGVKLSSFRCQLSIDALAASQRASAKGRLDGAATVVTDNNGKAGAEMVHCVFDAAQSVVNYRCALLFISDYEFRFEEERPCQHL